MIADILLERYLANDLPPDARSSVEAALQTDGALRARLAVLRSERTTFLAADPAAQFAHRVATIVAVRAKRPLWRMLLVPSLATAAVAVVAVSLLRVGHIEHSGPMIVSDTPSPPPPAAAPAPPATPPPVAQPSAPVTAREFAKAPPSETADKKKGKADGFGEAVGSIAARDKDSAPAHAAGAAPADDESEQRRGRALSAPKAEKRAVEPPPPPAAAPVAVAPNVAAQGAAPAQPAPAASEASADEAAKPKPFAVTFDFGTTEGRVVAGDGGAKDKALAAAGSLSVRATIPADGFYSVLVFDPASKTVRAAAEAVAIEGGRRALARIEVDHAVRVIVLVAEEADAVRMSDDVQRAIKSGAKVAGVDHQARVEVTLAE